MKAYTSDRLRNVVLVGHGGTGETTLSEAMLLASGAISRLGSVDDGNTVSDYNDDEHTHRYSISASLLALEWNDHGINLFDVPVEYLSDVISDISTKRGHVHGVEGGGGCR